MKKKEEEIEIIKVEKMTQVDENRIEEGEIQRDVVETGLKLQVCALETNH